MDIGTFLGMTFMLFTGSQPDWADIAQKLIPASKAEILAEVKKSDEFLMKGDSVRVIPGQDPKEFSYTNHYEYIQVFNKWRGMERRTINESMVDAVLPMIAMEILFDVRENRFSLNIPVGLPVSLWHPEGIVVTWHSNGACKIGGGYQITSPEAIEFANKFLREPYIFKIKYFSEYRDFKIYRSA